jgi:hypothetical protein
MSTDTQISSFFVPENIWTQGYHARPDLPPLVLSTRDALDIERRARKRVNLRNESHRYILCCERIQGIVRELSQQAGLLPPPIVWPVHRTSNGVSASALAYLALIEAISWFLRGSPYSRVSTLFFPPEHAKPHLQIFEAIRQHTDVDQLVERAARNASLPGSTFDVTPGQCRIALDQRHELLRTAVSEVCGLVDVIELV